jgi:hypothetical protein
MEERKLSEKARRKLIEILEKEEMKGDTDDTDSQ